MIDLFEQSNHHENSVALATTGAEEGIITSTTTTTTGEVNSNSSTTTAIAEDPPESTKPTTTTTTHKCKPCNFEYCDQNDEDHHGHGNNHHHFHHGHAAPPSPHFWTELSSRVFYGDQRELAHNGVLTEGQMRDLQNYSIGVGHNGFDGRLLSEAFLSSGRTDEEHPDHALQLMAYHPDYLEIFLQTHHFLLRGDGPLPYTYRHYIAIMAAARFQCSYLMEIQKKEFLYQGGDPSWLRGMDAASSKLKSLYDINKMMAHRPWILKKEDFISLTKKAGWSIAEIVHAVVLLAHFHALSSFIHGCGIHAAPPTSPGGSSGTGATSSTEDPLGLAAEAAAAEPTAATAVMTDSMISNNTINQAYFSKPAGGGSGSGSSPPTNHHEASSPTKCLKPTNNTTPTATPTKNNNNTNKSGDVGNMNNKGTSEVEVLMAKMRNLSETVPIEDPEERQKRFETVASSDDTHEKENRLSMLPSAATLPADVSPFVLDSEFRYEDFAKRGQVNELHTFRIQDYSWEEHGFSLINRMYADVGNYLDEKFKVAQNMTYNTMGGNTHVDTTKFRTAVWNYIQCLYGIRHDDYDYGEVNQLLERPLKSYIKKVCCFPERITKADRDSVMVEFKYSEKVHVNLMIMEAKIQAELLYALRTIMRFFL